MRFPLDRRALPWWSAYRSARSRSQTCLSRNFGGWRAPRELVHSRFARNCADLSPRRFRERTPAYKDQGVPFGCCPQGPVWLELVYATPVLAHRRAPLRATAAPFVTASSSATRTTRRARCGRRPMRARAARRSTSRSPGVLITRTPWSCAPPPRGSKSYSATRGDLAALDTWAYGPCLGEGISGTTYDDAAVPAPGQGYLYLIQPWTTACGAGTLGAIAPGVERLNPDPARSQ